MPEQCFRYCSGEIVEAGDIVNAGFGGLATVVLILRAGTEAAAAYSAPEGGFLIRDECAGLVLIEPATPDWEDVELVSRGAVPDDPR